MILAPCQWGFHPDSNLNKLMINYSMTSALTPDGGLINGVEALSAGRHPYLVT